MKKAFVFAAAIMLFTTSVFGAGGTIPGGGTEADPFLIEDFLDFQAFCGNTSYWDDYTRLDCDLDLDPALSGRETYTKAPIAGNSDNDSTFNGTAFTGTFDGNNHVISNLTVNGSYHCGMFGNAPSSEIKNLGLENVDITGSGLYIGGLAGYGYGTLTNCYTTGSVTNGKMVGGLVGYSSYGIDSCYSTCSVEGTDIEVGGLVGVNTNSITNSYATGNTEATFYYYVGGLVGTNFGSITNCYAAGQVTAWFKVGGLAGRNIGSIINCYSNGEVIGVSSEIGGLVGYVASGSITSSFWDIQTSGMTIGIGLNESTDPITVTGLETVDMQTKSTFTNALWDFADDDGDPAVWYMPVDDYPVLAWQVAPDPKYSGGNGIEGDPYIIATIEDWDEFEATSDDWSSHFLLTTDIDLTGRTYTQAPIAGDTDADSTFDGIEFSGTFNGNRYVVRNLTIDGAYYCGLFGKTSYAEIHNLGVEDASMSCAGIYNSGLVAYQYYGRITGSYSNVELTSGSDAGGLVGYNERGIIKDSYSSGTVDGGKYTGGLVGHNERGDITNSYSSSKVTGNVEVGGLVGHNLSGHISDSYAVGIVDATGVWGGLVGNNAGSPDVVNTSYFYIYAGPDTDQGIALDDEQLQDKSSFAGFDFAGDASDGTNDYWTITPGYMPRLTWQPSPGLEAPGLIDSITTILSGTGYANDPFIIANYDDMMEFKSNTTLRIGHYSLASDIDLSGTTYTEAFIPESFGGSFIGNGHKISNLTIDAGNGNSLGFFKLLHGSVDNLALGNVSITGSGGYVGGVSGTNYYGSITGSSSAGTINGRQYVGGLVGYNNRGDITTSSTDGTIIGTGDYIGGLTGCNYDGNIDKSYSSCNVTGNDYVGGLTGWNDQDITECYSVGKVIGDKNVGGLVGWNDSFSWIIRCYSRGDVSGSDTYIGGLVGINFSGDIANSYSTGFVNGSGDVGGLVGRDNYNDIENSFWDTETSGMTDGVGNKEPDPEDAIGKNTLDMQRETIFTDAGWDFESVWDICEDMNYPRFQWQILAGDLICPYGVDEGDLEVFVGCWLEDVNMDGDVSDDGIINLADLAMLALDWMADCSGGCVSDVTGDGAADEDDLYVFADQWLRTDECVIADLSGDEFVNGEDFAIFSGNWLEGRTPIVGDISGDWRVDYVDMSRLSGVWQVTSVEEGWDADCDLYADDVIDVLDVVKLAEHWLEDVAP